MSAGTIHPDLLEERVITSLARLAWLKERINDWRKRSVRYDEEARFQKANHYHALALDILRDVEETRRQAKEAHLPETTLAELETAFVELLALTVVTPAERRQSAKEIREGRCCDLEDLRRELSARRR